MVNNEPVCKCLYPFHKTDGKCKAYSPCPSGTRFRGFNQDSNEEPGEPKCVSYKSRWVGGINKGCEKGEYICGISPVKMEHRHDTNRVSNCVWENQVFCKVDKNGGTCKVEMANDHTSFDQGIAPHSKKGEPAWKWHCFTMLRCCSEEGSG